MKDDQNASEQEPTPTAEGDREADPLKRLIGLVDDPNGPTDLAENHDHYLYGAPKKRP